MRRLLLLTAALFSCATSAFAVERCPSAADQSAYEVLALRQIMTVLATHHCGRENDYNVNFVKRFQSAIQANDREVQAYFRRAYGGRGRGVMDTFTTELVNILSQQGDSQGVEFCPRTGLIVNEMVALRTQAELASYAAVKNLIPEGLHMCPPVARRR